MSDSRFATDGTARALAPGVLVDQHAADCAERLRVARHCVEDQARALVAALVAQGIANVPEAAELEALLRASQQAAHDFREAITHPTGDLTP